MQLEAQSEQSSQIHTEILALSDKVIHAEELLKSLDATSANRIQNAGTSEFLKIRVQHHSKEAGP